jgi:hypothetical protein
MSNAQQAFENYILWLKYSPTDYAGATTQAGYFIDTVEELDELKNLIVEAGKIKIS